MASHANRFENPYYFISAGLIVVAIGYLGYTEIILLISHSVSVAPNQLKLDTVIIGEIGKDPQQFNPSTITPTVTATATLEPTFTATSTPTLTLTPTENPQQTWLNKYKVLKTTGNLTLGGDKTGNRITAENLQILEKNDRKYAYSPAKPINQFELKGELEGVASYQKINTTEKYVLQTLIPVDSDGNLSFQFLDKDKNLSIMKFKYDPTSKNGLGSVVTNKPIPLGQEWRALPAGVIARFDEGVMKFYVGDKLYVPTATSTPTPQSTKIAVVEAPKTPVPQFETFKGTAMEEFAKAHGIQCPVGTTVEVVGNQYWLYSFGNECTFGNVPFIGKNLAGVGILIPGEKGGWTNYDPGVSGWDAKDITDKAGILGFEVVGYKYSVYQSGEKAYLGFVLAKPKGK
ncbi:hypothetical protein HZB69_03190 [Candidatus Amesbacteria bacterium]|nr:hypothetical protein [Candidatus Amesbacteria bacterium]